MTAGQGALVKYARPTDPTRTCYPVIVDNVFAKSLHVTTLQQMGNKYVRYQHDERAQRGLVTKVFDLPKAPGTDQWDGTLPQDVRDELQPPDPLAAGEADPGAGEELEAAAAEDNTPTTQIVDDWQTSQVPFTDDTVEPERPLTDSHVYTVRFADNNAPPPATPVEPEGIDDDSSDEPLAVALAAEEEGVSENIAKGHLEATAEDVARGLHDEAMYNELARFCKLKVFGAQVPDMKGQRRPGDRWQRRSSKQEAANGATEGDGNDSDRSGRSDFH